MPALELDVALRAHEPRRRARQRASSSAPTSTSTTSSAWPRSAASCPASSSSRPSDSRRRTARSTRCASTARMVDGVIEAPGGAHFTECPPDYGRDEAFQREYAATREGRRRLAEVPARATSTCPRPSTRRRSARAGREAMSDATRAEVCAVAVADALPRRRRDPGEPLRHRARDRRAPREAHLRARPADDRRHRLAASRTCRPSSGRTAPSPVVEGWLPFRSVFDLLWCGPPPRDDGARARSTASATRTSPASATAREAEGAAARHARRAGQHHQPPHELLGAEPLAAGLRRRRSTSSPASATTAPPRSGRRRALPRRCAAWSRTSASSTSRRRTTRCASSPCIPA